MDLPILALCVACLILWRVGVLLYMAGASRSKHAASAAIRSICELVTSALCFWAIGAAILQQERNGWFWIDHHRLFSDAIGTLFTLTMVLVGTALAVAPMAERGRFLLVAPLTALLSAIIIPVVGHWTWHGVLLHNGGIDIGGALPILICPAVVGLVAAAMVGPRSNKYNRDGSANAIPGHNAILMAGGVLLMAGGWIAYLALAHWRAELVPFGFPAGIWRTVFNGILSASAGAAAAMVYGYWRYRRVDLSLILMGIVAGMCSITAGVGLLPPWLAVLLAAVASVLGLWTAAWVDIRWRIDDAGNLAVVVLTASILSLLVSPLVIATTWVTRIKSMSLNGLGVAMGIAVAGLAAWGLLTVIRRFTKLRVSESAEYDGLDLAEHDQNAYPDFQQTMIKSYHLRER